MGVSLTPSITFKKPTKSTKLNSIYSNMSSEPEINKRKDQISAASFLPIIATYNLRSLLPKMSSLKTDLVERKIDVAFSQEVWEPSDNPLFIAEIEKLHEIHGLKYVSKPRSKTLKGRYHGGAAHIVNIENFSLETLADVDPKSLKVMWGII